MGTFRVEVQAMGGHGCVREAKDGATVAGCGNETCPDCITREYIAKLKKTGVSFVPSTNPDNDGYARLTHWPGHPDSVVDNLLTGIRKGSF